MKFRELVAEENSSLKRKYNSKQYFLSQEMIGLKLALKMNQKTISKLLGISYSDYLELEGGSLLYSPTEYKDAIRKLRRVLNENND